MDLLLVVNAEPAIAALKASRWESGLLLRKSRKLIRYYIEKMADFSDARDALREELGTKGMNGYTIDKDHENWGKFITQLNEAAKGEVEDWNPPMITLDELDRMTLSLLSDNDMDILMMVGLLESDLPPESDTPGDSPDKDLISEVKD